LLSLIISDIKAQKKSGEFIFTGIVIDEYNTRPVTLCHIFNESKRRGFLSDDAGKFKTRVSAGDTVVYTALGYLGKMHIIKAGDTIAQKIILTPQTYEIEPVIINIPKTYKDLKKAILCLDTDNNKPMPELPYYNPYIRKQLLDTNVIYDRNFMVMHPVSGLYYRFSKEEKSKRMLSYLKEQELKQPAVDAKFNRDIVSRITGLKDDDLNNFIGYCNFNFNYLYKATPLEIVDSIYIKYHAFKKCCIKQDPITD
jgi:hypothetical protein